MSNCDSKPRLLFIYLLAYIIEAKWIEFIFMQLLTVYIKTFRNQEDHARIEKWSL